MPHASVMTSRTTTSAARSAPAAAATSGSIARRAPSAPTPSLRPSAAPAGAPSPTPPRSPWSSARRGRLPGSLAIASGTSSRYGRRPRRPRPDESAGTAPAKPTACAPSSGRMTTTRPTPARAARPPRASRRARAARLPFFEPRGDGLARDSALVGLPYFAALRGRAYPDRDRRSTLLLTQRASTARCTPTGAENSPSGQPSRPTRCPLRLAARV
jgi:hypothetical protein